MDEVFDDTVKERQVAKPVSPAPRPPAPVRSPSRPIVSAPEADTTERFAAEVEPVTGWLVIVKGPGRGRSFPLGIGIHSVGRGEKERVRISFGDKSISRHHVEISHDPKGPAFYVSAAPAATMLAHCNGQPLLPTVTVTLQAGDRISLGKTELLFVPLCGPTFNWQEE
ncbi:MAG TPA: FHA domain-containing protein [Chthoniobacteraceae bacterium]|jgi:hypothetical protein|nr:FHA domain-containing protein [Chthoniobacteraceae bacterium]